MKKNICCVLLTLVIVSILYISSFDTTTKEVITSGKDIKYVDSELLVAEIPVIEETVEEVSEEVETEVEEVIVSTDTVVQVTKEEVIEYKEPTDIVVEEIAPVPQNEVIVGKMSGYGPDCIGCSGYLAYGTYVGNGNVYYNDSDYGQVRIVAGDRKYKFGTIVKINDSILAIVLDRGGSIGIGKKFLFDLLYSSEAEASKYGISNNTKFEILRYGF